MPGAKRAFRQKQTQERRAGHTHAETNEAEQDTVHSYFFNEKLTKGKKNK